MFPELRLILQKSMANDCRAKQHVTTEQLKSFETNWKEGCQYRIILIYEADVSMADCQNNLEKV